MPFALIPPGQRAKRVKGKLYVNRVYYVRGTVDGRDVEVSAKTTDKAAAKRFARDLWAKLEEGRVPTAGEAVTFARAAEFYSAFKSPSDADQARLDALKALIGARFVADLQHADLVGAANTLQPNGAPGTKNREVMGPAAAVMHYAAEQRWCAWLRVKLFKTPKPKTRAVSVDTAVTIVGAIPDLPTYARPRSAAFLARARVRQHRKRLLLLWLFRQANRISDALRTAWEAELCEIDLARRVVRHRVSKTDEWREKPIDDEVWEELANIPEAERVGRLFPWSSRTSVYNWLRPLARGLGVRFTPHMARHSVGRWLNEQGAGLRTIMEALDHKDAKSSIRYQSADVEVVRAAIAKLPRLVDVPSNVGAAPGKKSA